MVISLVYLNIKMWKDKLEKIRQEAQAKSNGA